MSREAGFCNVKDIKPIAVGAGATPATEGILVRDFNGNILDCLALLPDGHFQGRYGKVHREDVGEYVVRLVGHPFAAKL